MGRTGQARRCAPPYGSASVPVSGVSGWPLGKPEACQRDRIRMGSRNRARPRRIDGGRLTPQGLMDVHAVIDDIDRRPNEGEQAGSRRDGQYRRRTDLTVRAGMTFRTVADRREDDQDHSGQSNGSTPGEEPERRPKVGCAQRTDQPATPTGGTSGQGGSRRGQGRKHVHQPDSGAATAKPQSPATFCQGMLKVGSWPDEGLPNPDSGMLNEPQAALPQSHASAPARLGGLTLVSGTAKGSLSSPGRSPEDPYRRFLA